MAEEKPPTNVLDVRGASFVAGTKGGGALRVLDDISFSIQSGEVLALLGPSGAGKTALMDMLMLELTGKIVSRSGSFTLNGHPIKGSLLRKYVVMTPQFDNHNAFLTCRETLEFAADMYDAPDEQVESIIDAFGLRDCQDTRVGNAFLKGMSGGQKKRLSLAVAMLKQPAVILMDEPTSGLDAAGAAAIMKFLSEMARERNVIIMATIHQVRPRPPRIQRPWHRLCHLLRVCVHVPVTVASVSPPRVRTCDGGWGMGAWGRGQPSTSVFLAFDKTLVLSGGQICYCGPAAELAPFCAEAGNPLPPNSNPADIFLEMVNSEFVGKEAVQAVVQQWRAKGVEEALPEVLQTELPEAANQLSFCAELCVFLPRPAAPAPPPPRGSFPPPPLVPRSLWLFLFLSLSRARVVSVTVGLALRGAGAVHITRGY
jgi:ABC-type multidrug transport system ATPase subunit